MDTKNPTCKTQNLEKKKMKKANSQMRHITQFKKILPDKNDHSGIERGDEREEAKTYHRHQLTGHKRGKKENRSHT